ncbi:MAG TPA: MazF family transcriptional regulator [Sulfurospirillum sp. UBA12182]|nr:MAG TPA: MazF family transcriptional regulator [Sulfurospirillum sp. UBA12182]
MQVSLIDIGTSKGIRIPASILKMFEKPTSFDLHVKENKIILDVLDNPRSGWEEKFKNSDNKLLIEDDLDIEEWDEL